MRLVIRAHSLRGAALSQAIVGEFDERGGTLGRSDSNTMALPDPERHVSRLQAQVHFAQGQFHIRNVGTANPIVVGGHPVEPGEEAPLAQGDTLTIGGYELQVSLQYAPQVAPAAQAAAFAVDPKTVIGASLADGRTHPPQLLASRLGAPAGSSAGAIPAPAGAAAPRIAAAAALAAATPSTPPVPPAAQSLSAHADPFADLLGMGAAAASGAGVGVGQDAGPRADPFADLLGPSIASGAPSVAASTVARSVAPVAAPVQQAVPAAAPARLPDNFDPFADWSSAASPAAAAAPSEGLLTPGALAQPAAHGASPFADFIGAAPSVPPSSAGRSPLIDPQAAPGSLDAAFGLSAPSSSGDVDPLHAFLNPGTAAAAPGAANASGHHGLHGGPSLPDHTPDLFSAFQPPPVQRASPPLAPAAMAPTVPMAAPRPSPPPAAFTAPLPVPAPASVPTSVPQQEAVQLWQAFCQGAGIRLPGVAGLTPEMMTLIGATLRQAVEGTVQLAAARTAAKQELKAQVTTIQTKNNNPLKFAPDAAAALAFMLQPPMRGFMAAPEAMQDAMADLLGHTVGTMAGTQAAMKGMLARFEPAQLQAQLSKGGVLEALLPMNRKARLWELYLQHFERLSESAREDFDALFGKAFVQAYEAQSHSVAQAARRET